VTTSGRRSTGTPARSWSGCWTDLSDET
jgi:hypothetical protein